MEFELEHLAEETRPFALGLQQRQIASGARKRKFLETVGRSVVSERTIPCVASGFFSWTGMFFRPEAVFSDRRGFPSPFR